MKHNSAQSDISPTKVSAPVPPVLTGTTPEAPTTAASPHVSSDVATAVTVAHEHEVLVVVALVVELEAAVVEAGMAAMRVGAKARATVMIEAYILRRVVFQ